VRELSRNLQEINRTNSRDKKHIQTMIDICLESGPISHLSLAQFYSGRHTQQRDYSYSITLHHRKAQQKFI